MQYSSKKIVIEYLNLVVEKSKVVIQRNDLHPIFIEKTKGCLLLKDSPHTIYTSPIMQCHEPLLPAQSS